MSNSLWLLIFGTISCLLSISTDSFSLHVITSPILWLTLLVLILRRLPAQIGKVLSFLLAEVVMMASLADIFCQEQFSSPLTPQLLGIVFTTDRQEAHEFLTTFISRESLLQPRVAAILLLMLIYPLVHHRPQRIPRLTPPRPVRILAASLLFVLSIYEAQPTLRFLQLIVTAPAAERVESMLMQRYGQEMQTPVHRLLYSWSVCRATSHTLARIRQATGEAAVETCTYASPHIVLVIGESYNKHHSTLYGYPYDTTPHQEQRHQRGELIVFTDVVTPWNITSNVFLELFSLWDSSAHADIGHCPLFPVLFKRAGYQVSLYSNQYIARGIGRESENQSGNFFLNDSALCDTMFTYRNTHVTKYDHQLIEQFGAKIQTLTWSSQPTLDILHLRGQHFNYSQRYPQEYAKFESAYDNATYYNDAVLEALITQLQEQNVIVIYVSDHGEEVYDQQHRHGRHFQEPTPDIARNEYEVPMWIWCSSQYRAINRSLFQAIGQAKDQPYLTDDLPQLLCHLAGIQARYLQPTRDILSPHYAPKPRLIWGSVDYDTLK